MVKATPDPMPHPSETGGKTPEKHILKNSFHSTPDQYRMYENRSIDNAIKDGRITTKDAKYIKEFLAETNSQNNLSAQRKFKLASNLTTVFRYLPPVEEITITDLYEAVENLKEGKNLKGKPYTRNTQSDLLRILKRFILWCIENNYLDLDVKKVSKIKIPAYVSKTKKDEDILSEEEVLKIINTPRSIRYKALIAILYEGGLRIQEAADLKWEDVRFSSWGCRIRTAGKTEKERNIPIMMYAGLLAKWQSEHPDPSPGNYVFLNQHNNPLLYQSIAKTFQQFVKDAGIERKITPHYFRHSRITHCLRKGMQETLCKQTFWGNPNSDMLKVYSHLTPDDTERAFAKMAGVEMPEESTEASAMTPVQCSRCHTINAPGSRFCARCGLTLSAEAVKEYDDAIAFVENKFQNLSDSERFELMAELSKYK